MARKANPKKRPFLQPSGFSVEVVNEIAREISLKDPNRIKELHGDLARFPIISAISAFQDAEKSVRPTAKKMKDQASKILDTFDSLSDVQAFFIRPHSHELSGDRSVNTSTDRRPVILLTSPGQSNRGNFRWFSI